MRLYLNLSASKEFVKFDYQHDLAGVFHRWLGDNDLHDKISLYSMSWLKNAEVSKAGLRFPNGSSFFVSFYEETYGKQLAAGILRSPEVFSGMSVSEIRIQPTPSFRSREVFRVAGPVLIKRKAGERIEHLLFNNPDADSCLTSTLLHKLDAAGLKASAKVQFDSTHQNPRTKLVTIGTIKNRASVCPVIVEGDQLAVAFAWNVGVGNSTGVGFGALV